MCVGLQAWQHNPGALTGVAVLTLTVAAILTFIGINCTEHNETIF